jgi:dipeptidyl aminopeptidase/acylaminoacyl peptidase
VSFHPDITNLTRFSPHAYSELVALNALPEGAVPEPVYEKMKSEYTGVTDVDVFKIHYRYDGLTITGIIAAPQHSAENITPKHDLVLYNRGGSGNYGLLTLHTVMRQFIPLARAGYVVAGSNYRGNDGGDGKDEFGGRDVDDVFALHDIMRAHPLVNDAPCFTIGHSRGGMMTYLLMKYGLKMRAAVVLAGASDLMSTTDFREEMRERVYMRYIPDFEHRSTDALRERSAVCWPEQLTAPLLLMHGTNDNAVPHTQSEALATKLATLNKPHELVLFEQGNHALVRHWSEVQTRTHEWLKRYA